MTAILRSAGRRAAASFWVAAVVTLFVAHDAVLLVQLGPGEALAQALREGGHAYWAVASMLLAALGVALLAGTGVRLALLRRLARSLGAHVAPSAGDAFGRRAARTWARLLVLVAVGFVIQENVEHAVSHGHVPGLGALAGPEYPLALPVLASITALAAVLVTVARGIERALVLAIVAALRAVRRAPRSLHRAPRTVAARRSHPIASATAGRAPPLVVAFA